LERLMIAVSVHPDVVLAGVAIPAHRTLEVVEDVDAGVRDGERNVLSAGEARALVQAGYAEPIEADFDRLADLIDGWQHA
jgi:hypothetical protein